MKLKKLNVLGNITIFLCIFFKYLITYSIATKYLYVLLLVIIAFTIINIFSIKMYKKEFLLIILFMLISLYFVIFYNDVNFFISVCLAILFLKKDSKTYIKNFLISSIILFLLTILLNKFQLLTSNNMIRKTSDGIKTRYSLGFSHPNEVFLFFLPIALSLYYLSNKKIVYCGIVVVAYILYTLSYSRTGLVAVLMIFLLDIIIRNNNRYKIQNKIIKLMPYMMLIFTIISVIITVIYGKEHTNAISNLFSGRPYYWNYYVENNMLFTLFGKNKVIGNNLDNYYLYILVELGMLSYIIYTIIYYNYFKKNSNILERKEIVIALVFFIYGLCEANVIIGSINFLFAKQISDIINQENKISVNKDVSYESER